MEIGVGVVVLGATVLVAAGLLAGEGFRQAVGLGEDRVDLALTLDATHGLGPGAPVQFVGQTVGSVRRATLEAPDAPAAVRIEFYVTRSFFEDHLRAGDTRWSAVIREPLIPVPGAGTKIEWVEADGESGGQRIDADTVLRGTVPAGLLDEIDDLPGRAKALLDRADQILADVGGISTEARGMVDHLSGGGGTLGRVLMDEALADRVAGAVGALEGLLSEAETLTADTLSERLPPMLDRLSGILADVESASGGLPAMRRQVDASLVKANNILGAIQRLPILRGGIAADTPPTSIDLLRRPEEEVSP